MSLPEYPPNPVLQQVWSPADTAKLAEHAAKFDSLPAMPVVTSAMMPAHDGDTAELAELAELADRVFFALDEAFNSAKPFSFHFHDAPIYEQMRMWFNPPISQQIPEAHQ